MEKIRIDDVTAAKDFENLRYDRMVQCKYRNEYAEGTAMVLTGDNVPPEKEIMLDSSFDSTPLTFKDSVCEDFLGERPFLSSEMQILSTETFKENVTLQDVKDYLEELADPCENFLPVYGGSNFVLTEDLCVGKSQTAPTVDNLYAIKNVEEMDSVEPLQLSAGTFKFDLYPGYELYANCESEYSYNGGLDTELVSDFAQFKLIQDTDGKILVSGEEREDHMGGEIIRTIEQAQKRFDEIVDKGNFNVELGFKNLMTNEILLLDEYLTRTGQIENQVKSSAEKITDLMDEPFILKNDNVEINLLPGYALDVEYAFMAPARNENGSNIEKDTVRFELGLGVDENARRIGKIVENVCVNSGWNRFSLENAKKIFEELSTANTPYDGRAIQNYTITHIESGKKMSLDEYQKKTAKTVSSPAKEKANNSLEDR